MGKNLKQSAIVAIHHQFKEIYRKKDWIDPLFHNKIVNVLRKSNSHKEFF